MIRTPDPLLVRKYKTSNHGLHSAYVCRALRQGAPRYTYIPIIRVPKQRCLTISWSVRTLINREGCGSFFKISELFRRFDNFYTSYHCFNFRFFIFRFFFIISLATARRTINVKSNSRKSCVMVFYE